MALDFVSRAKLRQTQQRAAHKVTGPVPYSGARLLLPDMPVPTPQAATFAAILKGEVVQKYNPNHDENGRFSSSDSSGAQSYKDPQGRDRSVGLNPRERSAELSFYKKIENDPQGMIDQYHKLFGNNIDPDNVKMLSSAFVKDQGLAAAVHEPSSLLSKMIWSNALDQKAKAGDTSPTVLTAGGGGSGKGATLAQAKSEVGAKPDAVTFDSVLGNRDSAIKKIDEALAKTKGDVAVLYTNTPFEKALTQNATRGRTLSGYTVMKSHIGASNNIKALSEHYADNPRVKIVVSNNFGGLKDTHIGSLKDVPTYDKALLEPKIKEIADNLKQRGVIDDTKYNLLTRKISG